MYQVDCVMFLPVNAHDWQIHIRNKIYSEVIKAKRTKSVDVGDIQFPVVPISTTCTHLQLKGQYKISQYLVLFL